jgi:phage-related protein
MAVGETVTVRVALRLHTGGITGRGQMPTLHTGGLASKFADLPSHNEVDVRLLRNEIVSTEAQQSNLMRMIDAGQTNKGEGTFDDSKMVALLKDINRSIQNSSQNIELDGREVGRLIERYVSEEQVRNNNRRERF